MQFEWVISKVLWCEWSRGGFVTNNVRENQRGNQETQTTTDT